MFHDVITNRLLNTREGYEMCVCVFCVWVKTMAKFLYLNVPLPAFLFVRSSRLGNIIIICKILKSIFILKEPLLLLNSVHVEWEAEIQRKCNKCSHQMLYIRFCLCVKPQDRHKWYCWILENTTEHTLQLSLMVILYFFFSFKSHEKTKTNTGDMCPKTIKTH